MSKFVNYDDVKYNRRKDDDRLIALTVENDKLREWLIQIGQIAVSCPTTNDHSYVSSKLCREIAEYLGMLKHIEFTTEQRKCISDMVAKLNNKGTNG